MGGMKRFFGEVAVTRSSRGIGRAIALRPGNDGGLVAVNHAGNLEAAHSLVDGVVAASGETGAIQAKLGSASKTGNLFNGFEKALRNQGRDSRLDILVNNADAGHFGKRLEVPEQTVDKVFATSRKAPPLSAPGASCVSPR